MAQRSTLTPSSTTVPSGKRVATGAPAGAPATGAAPSHARDARSAAAFSACCWRYVCFAASRAIARRSVFDFKGANLVLKPFLNSKPRLAAEREMAFELSEGARTTGGGFGFEGAAGGADGSGAESPASVGFSQLFFSFS